MYWSFSSPAASAAGAIPPEPLNLKNSKIAPESPFKGERTYLNIWQSIEAGYRVIPGDCPPVRLISRFGFMLKCPGDITVRQIAPTDKLRHFSANTARFGKAEVGGTSWEFSDSGFVASWVAGSEFFKIHTGIVVFFSEEDYLYQGPLPNMRHGDTNLDVMAGLEFMKPDRVQIIGGQKYCVAQMNVIARLPPQNSVLTVKRGEAIGWFFCVPKENPTLNKLPERLE